MKKYLKQVGYKFTESDDLIANQFRLVGGTLTTSSASTFKGVKLDKQEVYELFLKTVDFDSFAEKIESAINSATADSFNYETEITVENQENGYLCTMIFTKQGL